MEVTVIKHTTLEDARRALASTVGKDFSSKATLAQIYTWKHSPIRTQIFEITLKDIPTFVSVHLARHVMAQPFVTSKREDRGGNGKEDRYTPVDMTIWINAEALMAMANKRLCYQASKETREVMIEIDIAISKVDRDLSDHLVPACVAQGGYCREPKPCGWMDVKKYNPIKITNRITL